MTTGTLPTIEGKALYLELAPLADPHGSFPWHGEGSRTQIIITPSAEGADIGLSRDVEPYILSRTLSRHYPKSTWDWNQIRPVKSFKEILQDREDEIKAEPTAYWRRTSGIVPKEDFEAYSADVQKSLYANDIRWYLKSLFVSLDRHYNEEEKKYDESHFLGKTITTSFSVEVTSADLEALMVRKTPQALVRRIVKTRLAKGLSETIYEAI